MGIQLVSVALTAHANLSDRAFRVLVRMAAQALDTKGGRGQQPGLYFGGWEPLGLVLGREVPSIDEARHDPDARRSRDRVQETVRRALAELQRAGVVESLGRARTGTRQTYRLNLSPTVAVPLSPTVAVPLAGVEPHRGGGLSPTVAVPPRKEEEPGTGEDLPQDQEVVVAASRTDRAREADRKILNDHPDLYTDALAQLADQPQESTDELIHLAAETVRHALAQRKTA